MTFPLLCAILKEIPQIGVVMTTKVQKLTIEEVRALPKEKKLTPKKPNLFWRTLLKLLSSVDLMKTHFQV